MSEDNIILSKVIFALDENELSSKLNEWLEEMQELSKMTIINMAQNVVVFGGETGIYLTILFSLQ